MNENIDKSKDDSVLHGTDIESNKGEIDIPQKLSDLEKRADNVTNDFKNLQNDFNKLERNIDKTNNFMMWVVSISIGVFIVSGILIGLDYFKNNQERYEQFINKTEEIKNNFYSKEELKNLIDENDKNRKILDCIKIKGYFTILFFK